MSVYPDIATANGSITLNDGTFLYNSDQLRNYLAGLGFNEFNDFQEIVWSLRKDVEGHDNGDEFDEPETKGDDWEAIADGYYCAYNNLYQEVEDMCEKFLSGRKITKAKFVDWLLVRMEDALINY